MTERELKELSSLLKKLESEVRNISRTSPDSDSRGQPVATGGITSMTKMERVLHEIESYGPGLRTEHLLRKFRAIDAAELNDILTRLVGSGKVRNYKQSSGKGRPSNWYQAI